MLKIEGADVPLLVCTVIDAVPAVAI